MMGAGGLELEPANLDEASSNVESAINGSGSYKPDVALAWQEVSIKFRIVGQEANEEFELFPNLDAAAPSARSLMLQKRLLKRTQGSHNSNTLSGYIGSSASTNSERSCDNQSVASNSNSNKSGDEKPGRKPVKHCPICKKPFHKATYLKRHIMSHSNVKPYKCAICNWGFYQQCNLKRHMASHTAENDAEGFKCTHCSAAFTTKSVLSVHMRDSHGEPAKKTSHQSLVKTTPSAKSPPKPSAVKSPVPSNLNKCTICGKQFLTQENLKSHLLYHRGHKSFKCPTCGSRFAQKTNLRKHMSLAHAGNQCPHCSITFRSEQDLSQHITSLHPDAVVDNEEPMLKLDDDEESMTEEN